MTRTCGDGAGTTGPGTGSAKVLVWRAGLLLLGLALVSASGCRTASKREPPLFIPPPPEKPRLQVLLAFSNEGDLNPRGKTSLALLGKQEKRERGFNKPYGALMRGRKLYVADTMGHTVLVVDFAQRKIDKLAGAHTMGTLKVPVNLAVDASQNLYVADMGRRQVLVYDRSDRFVRAIGDGEKLAPSGVAVRGDRVYVSDVKNHCVVVFDAQSGREVSRLGKAGLKQGELNFPTNIALDMDGAVYVSEALAGRLQKLSPEGKFLKQFGQLGRNIGELVRPKGIAVDRRQRVYVADAATEHVQVFDRDGKLLLFFGGNRGTRDSLYLPAGLSLTYDPEAIEVFKPHVAPGYEVEYLLIAVSQYGRYRISVFGFLAQK